MEQSNELTIQKDENKFIEELNQVTGHKPQAENPVIKFNSKEGKFYQTFTAPDGEKQEIDLGEKVKVHIIRKDRHIIQSGMDSEMQVTSGETSDYFVTLKDKETGENIEVGEYKNLKLNKDYDLKYSKVLYVFYKDKAHRMYLGGTKLGNWFEYEGHGNPALVETVMSKGKQVKAEKGKSDYYELNFEKGDRQDQKVIVDRVNEINKFILSFDSTASQTVAPKQVEEPHYEAEVPEVPEIVIEDEITDNEQNPLMDM